MIINAENFIFVITRLAYRLVKSVLINYPAICSISMNCITVIDFQTPPKNQQLEGVL